MIALSIDIGSIQYANMSCDRIKLVSPYKFNLLNLSKLNFSGNVMKTPERIRSGI